MSQAAAPTLDPVSFSRFAGDFAGFSKDLGDSFARFGFAVVRDHGLPQARIEAALGAAKAFFALSEPAKQAYKVGLAGQRGYTPFGVETAKDHAHYDLKEFWHVGRDLPAGHRFHAQMAANVWPDAELPDFRENVGWLFAALDAMGLKLLEAIAVWLAAQGPMRVPFIRWRFRGGRLM